MTLIQDGDTILADGKDVGSYIDGELSLKRGHHGKREEILAWLRGGDEAPVEPDEEAPESIPECPKGTPDMGDKDPAVVAWWFKYKPEEAVEKYQGRKFVNPLEKSPSEVRSEVEGIVLFREVGETDDVAELENMDALVAHLKALGQLQDGGRVTVAAIGHVAVNELEEAGFRDGQDVCAVVVGDKIAGFTNREFPEN